MGIIEAAPEPKREAPDMPDELADTYMHHKRLRFGRAEMNDQVTLIPRDPLTYTEIAHYAAVTGEQIQPWEIEVIMLIDAIFESRELGGDHG